MNDGYETPRNKIPIPLQSQHRFQTEPTSLYQTPRNNIPTPLSIKSEPTTFSVERHIEIAPHNNDSDIQFALHLVQRIISVKQKSVQNIQIYKSFLLSSIHRM